MKFLSILFVLVSISVGYGQKKKNYIVKLDSKDTIYYENVKLNFNFNKVKCKSSTGEEFSYKTEDLKAFGNTSGFQGLLEKDRQVITHFEIKHRNPIKKKGDMMPYIVIMKEGEYKILYFEAIGVDRSIITYYLFNNEECLEEIDKKNYKEILGKYFSSCPKFVETATTEKAINMHDNALKLEYKCR